MVLALGDYSGIYQWVYHLPGFGLFRHPAFFRGYSILCMLLIGGFAISRHLSGELSAVYLRRVSLLLLMMKLLMH
jgi:hypothetical protein